MMRPGRAAALLCGLLLSAGCAPVAQGPGAPGSASGAPPDLAALLALAPEGAAEGPAFAEERRRSAMRLAALSFGSRAGLARRGWEINRMLARHARSLSRIYRFRELLVEEAGFRLQPPVLAETRRAFRIAASGDRAATARRVLRIEEPERLVSAPPTWRAFLARHWARPAPPAALLFPRDGDERRLWRGWLAEGWAEGARQAEDIFRADLDRLNATFTGLAAWHRLHLARMVTAPTVEAERVAVSGSARLLRIGAVRARLGDRARFRLLPGQWRPLTAPAGGVR